MIRTHHSRMLKILANMFDQIFHRFQFFKKTLEKIILLGQMGENRTAADITDLTELQKQTLHSLGEYMKQVHDIA